MIPPLTSHLLPLTEEFAPNASEWPHDLSRRRFLQMMSASIALGGTSGCTRNPPEHILPYQRQPEEIIPGKPLYFATALTLGGYARGVLVETHEGRPTKIEGNPQHPASLGASDVFMQAELLTLYDPQRSLAVTRAGQISTWDIFIGELTTAAQNWKTNSGAGLRILTRHETSPTFLDQMHRLLAKYPAAKWHEWEPLQVQQPQAIYHFDKAQVVVSFGADFLASGPMSLRYARDFAAARRPNNGAMNRLYVAESTPSLTGAMADHRMILRPDEIEKFASELESGANPTAKLIGDDLRAHADKSLVVAGEFESAATHDAVQQLNESLGNIGATIDYVAAPNNGARDLRELVDEINAGAVETLLIIGGNAVYDAPAEFEFAKLVPKVKRSVHVGIYPDETAHLCQWHVREAHELETWSDAAALDGTVTIMQPMIDPLFAGRSRHELLSALLEEAPSSSYDIVRAFWQTQHNGADFENAWRKSLHDGIGNLLAVTSSPTAPASPQISNQKSEIHSHSLFAPARRLTTAVSQTTHGSRNFRSR